MNDNTILTPATAGPTSSELDAARMRAGDALAEAHAAVSEWAYLVRDGAADRVGSLHTRAVLADPAYEHAVDVFAATSRAAVAFNNIADRIEAGGLR